MLALTSEAKRDIESAKAYLRNEYSLDWLLECFSKPTVSFINGVCMGSGAGLTAYNTHRIAGENYKWAMPEAKIGLFPDVGIAHVLAKLPWPIGLYLGLTGRAIGREDAQWLGLVTHCIHSSRFGDILSKLSDAQPVDPLLDGLNETQEIGLAAKRRGLHSRIISRSRRLLKSSGLSRSRRRRALEWAKTTLADLRRASPLSLAITYRHIRSARTLDIRQTLIEDYRLAVRCLENHDFHEGVRAALRDKDGQPKWQPARLRRRRCRSRRSLFCTAWRAAISTLPSRTDMQAARV